MSITSTENLLEQLYQSIGVAPHDLRGRLDVARIEVHANRVLGTHLVPGLEVDADERDDGIDAVIRVVEGTQIEHPIQVCFGMIPPDGIQKINLRIEIGDGARAGILAHCTFPNARRIRHEMEADIRVGRGAQYGYYERHVHGAGGGVIVVPNSRVHVAEGGRFQTDFELIRGRVGQIDISMEATGEAHSSILLLKKYAAPFA